MAHGELLTDSEPAATRLDIVRRDADGLHADEDWVSTEVPVELCFNQQPFAVMMATPDDLEDLAYGFARSEAGVAELARIGAVRIHERLEGIQVDIEVAGPPVLPAGERNIPGRSGCGICGSRTLEDVVRMPPVIDSSSQLRGEALERALHGLREAQPIGRLTGSLHAAAWCSLDGGLQLVREDVGRHNALDKLLGAAWRQGLAMDDGFLVVTSRASYEMVTKAALAGIAIMVAVSAPTTLAVRLANSCGLSLIGFARPGRCLIYTHAHRFSDAITTAALPTR